MAKRSKTTKMLLLLLLLAMLLLLLAMLPWRDTFTPTCYKALHRTSSWQRFLEPRDVLLRRTSDEQLRNLQPMHCPLALHLAKTCVVSQGAELVDLVPALRYVHDLDGLHSL